MATILRSVIDNSILLVCEDINEFISEPQFFNVINGHWTGIYENGSYTHYECTDRNEPTDVLVYRNIEYNGDYETLIRSFEQSLNKNK